MAINKLGGQVAGVNPLITAVASMAPKNNYRTFPQTGAVNDPLFQTVNETNL